MADQYKLIMLPEAQKDIRDIVVYIARDQTRQMSERQMDKKDGDRIICERYLKCSPLYCNGIYRYHKTIWEGNSFMFLHKNGVVWDKIEVLPEMVKR